MRCFQDDKLCGYSELFKRMTNILALIETVTPQQGVGERWSEEYEWIAGLSF
ncbi:hypothetical protein J3D55_003291 [Chryseobacterium ginsenosidimutans]|nr:hypothetical protein [Chryseobacterium ginsenosidimutans]